MNIVTVQDLIDELEQYDPDMKVKISYDYGDHWHTFVAPDISSIGTGKVEYSSYHQMDKLIDEDKEDDEDDEQEDAVIITL